ncbi:polyadenylate-binding protein [Vigna unguiculata]|uniref:Polyadenylate-binding protein n=1 Tax=Vigna unguiculata TaxID=3917 RepID=A0A4D6LLR1_VIGUN|nr:polyadenylate-binding protein [Vigna unguiculata]
MAVPSSVIVFLAPLYVGNLHPNISIATSSTHSLSSRALTLFAPAKTPPLANPLDCDIFEQPSLKAKITGMLLEMDNGEFFVLLESLEALSTKVEEVVQVLKNTKIEVSGQDYFVQITFQLK